MYLNNPSRFCILEAGGGGQEGGASPFISSFCLNPPPPPIKADDPHGQPHPRLKSKAPFQEMIPRKKLLSVIIRVSN